MAKSWGLCNGSISWFVKNVMSYLCAKFGTFITKCRIVLMCRTTNLVNVNNVVCFALFSICPGTSLCGQLHCEWNKCKSQLDTDCIWFKLQQQLEIQFTHWHQPKNMNVRFILPLKKLMNTDILKMFCKNMVHNMNIFHRVSIHKCDHALVFPEPQLHAAFSQNLG